VRRSELSNEQLLALPRYQDSDLTHPEKLVMAYAAAMTSTARSCCEPLATR